MLTAAAVSFQRDLRQIQDRGPAEVDLLIGDAAKAEKTLGWKREISYPELIKRMVENDQKLLAEGKI